VTIFNCCLRISIAYFNATFVRKIGVDISELHLKRVFSNNYLSLISENSSSYLSDIIVQTEKATEFLFRLMEFFASLLMCLGILISLLLVDYKTTLFVFLIFSFCYFFLVFFLKKKISQISISNISSSDKRISALLDLLNYVRQVLLSYSQDFYISKFKYFDSISRKNVSLVQLYALIPKYFFEAFGVIVFSLIAIFSIFILKEEKIYLLTTLTILAYGTQKLLFSTNAIFQGWVYLGSNVFSVQLFINNINRNNLVFNINKITDVEQFKKLEFKQVNFRYKENLDCVFHNLSFIFENNSVIGIAGKSGCGKTTLLDLICGLLKANSGFVKINDVNMHNALYQWQKKIAYVPQNIYITENSILENILANNQKKYPDNKKLEEVLKVSLCDSFVMKAPQGVNTLIGKNGIRLSGGQAQRIGIARAIYNNPEILLLDEATNALDYLTEVNLMENLIKNFKNKLIIIISHKSSTLQYCNKIIYLKDKKISFQGTPEEYQLYLQ
jgi:ATP-binding cassette subfamily B protein